MAKKDNTITTYNQHVTKRYGERGSEKRTESVSYRGVN
jgi:hypothetical protein